MTSLKIRLLSGQHLPNPDISKDSKPFVKMSVRGHDEDSAEWQSSPADRGFSTVWDKEGTRPQEAEFNIRVVELAVLEMEVKCLTNNGKELDLGTFAISVTMMRTGYRNIALENHAGRRITPATLFVHVSKKEIPLALLKTPTDDLAAAPFDENLNTHEQVPIQ